jgi:hypothetical protein
MSARAEAPPTIAPLPRAATLLLAGAVLHLVISVITRTMMYGYLELSAPTVIGYLTAAMPLVLAASLVAGWDRWPAGRRWLVAAATAYGLVALLDIAGMVSMAIAWPPDSATELNPPITLVRIALLVTAALAAPLLAAAGLWRDGVAAPRLPFLMVAAAIGLIVLVVQVLTILPAFEDRGEESFLVGASVAVALVPAAVAALGIAAVRAVPRRYVVPEVLIAIGATAFAGGSAAVSATMSLVPRNGWEAPWMGPIATASNAMSLVGLAVIALGFFAARVSVPGEP